MGNTDTVTVGPQAPVRGLTAHLAYIKEQPASQRRDQQDHQKQQEVEEQQEQEDWRTLRMEEVTSRWVSLALLAGLQTLSSQPSPARRRQTLGRAAFPSGGPDHDLRARREM